MILGWYADSDFSNVDFRQILQDFSGKKIRLNNCKDNLKLWFAYSLNSSVTLKADTIAPSYTNTNKVSRAYSLFFTLYIDNSTI